MGGGGGLYHLFAKDHQLFENGEIISQIFFVKAVTKMVNICIELKYGVGMMTVKNIKFGNGQTVLKSHLYRY